VCDHDCRPGILEDVSGNDGQFVNDVQKIDEEGNKVNKMPFLQMEITINPGPDVEKENRSPQIDQRVPQVHDLEHSRKAERGMLKEEVIRKSHGVGQEKHGEKPVAEGFSFFIDD
jgi:hypothetical protein